EFDLPVFHPRTSDDGAAPQRVALSARDVRVRGLGPFTVDAPAGQVTHIAGPNGCGQTSLMLAAPGLVDYGGNLTAGRCGWADLEFDLPVFHPRTRDDGAAPQRVALSARDVRVRGLGPFTVDAPAGQVTHIAGPNGCGKTSLMLAALGLVDYGGNITAGRCGW